MTDYKTIFQDRDILQDSQKNFICRIYTSGSSMILSGDNRYPMLFVLQGELILSMKMRSVRVLSSGMIVIDTNSLNTGRCNGDTIILEYTPPIRLSEYLGKSCDAFNIPCSSIVPVLPPLREWIDSLLAALLKDSVWTREQIENKRRKLANILISYSREMLGELYMPFFACTRMSCKQCRNIKQEDK